MGLGAYFLGFWLLQVLHRVEEDYFPLRRGALRGQRHLWFTATVTLLFGLSGLAYLAWGGAWVVVPLAFIWMQVTHGVFHAARMGVRKGWVAGSGTCVLVWILAGDFVYRGVGDGISVIQHLVAAVVGSLITVAVVTVVVGKAKRSL